MRKPAFAAISVVLLVYGCISEGSEVKPGHWRHNITVDGAVRSYRLFLPDAYDGTAKMPLVIVLHGFNSNGEDIERLTGFSTKAEEESFIVAYPDGSGWANRLSWNSGNCCGYAHENNVDDVLFIRSMMDDIESNVKIDPDRVYLTGFSNGGMMSHALACELSDRLAAIAPVAGALNWVNCTPTTQVSVIVIHGTEDNIVRYNGGLSRMPNGQDRVDKPVSYAMSYWAGINGCTPIPNRAESDAVITETYRGCESGKEVELYSERGIGHVWLGGNRTKAVPTGEKPGDFSTTGQIWNFFKRQRRGV